MSESIKIPDLKDVAHLVFQMPTLEERDLLALTILLEAENQGVLGQIGIGKVIKNRMTRLMRGCHQIILRTKQFSCWNDKEYSFQRLRKIDQDIFAQCVWIAHGVLWNLIIDDPTEGADHYFNPSLVSPVWYKRNPEKVTVDIKDHRFMKLYS